MHLVSRARVTKDGSCINSWNEHGLGMICLLCLRCPFSSYNEKIAALGTSNGERFLFKSSCSPKLFK
jgi:hypothetical protein